MNQEYEAAVAVDSLVPHPANPRRGNVEAINESMEVHGFFGAVLVQRSTGHVIAGNHRLLVARQRGEATVPVIWLDVDDDQALRILLIDNRVNDLASYDDETLLELLSELEDAERGLAGTGYATDDISILLSLLSIPEAVPLSAEDFAAAGSDAVVLAIHGLTHDDVQTFRNLPGANDAERLRGLLGV